MPCRARLAIPDIPWNILQCGNNCSVPDRLLISDFELEVTNAKTYRDAEPFNPIQCLGDARKYFEPL
jgi:hypothetical protein